MFAADTDVIIKRGIDTIRICVVPTKTNTKVLLLLCYSVPCVYSWQCYGGMENDLIIKMWSGNTRLVT